MNIDIDTIFKLFNLCFVVIFIYLIYCISNTLRLIVGVLSNVNTNPRVVVSQKNKIVEQLPESADFVKIDESVYVSKISDNNIVENPHKTIGNTTSIKSDIEQQINQLKSMKKGS
jgi:hypothetical protein